MDASCMHFVTLIRACSRGELEHKKEWNTPDGLYAQMLLLDQYPRNCFRGTAEAFAYDPQAVKVARRIVQGGHHKAFVSIAQFLFLVTPGQHSEHLADHEMNMDVMALATEKFPGFMADMTMGHCKEHKAVVDRFGRYPHRNALLGRECTEEELAWLNDTEKLPGWAKSQIKT